MDDRSSMMARCWRSARRSTLVLPLIAGVLVRLAAFPLAHLRNLDLTKQWEYATIALNLAAGRGYSFDWYYLGPGRTLTLPTAYMPPGQVMVHLLALGTLGDNLSGHILLFCEEVFFGGIFLFGMWKLLSLLFGASSLTTRLGVWLAALYPSFIVASTTFGVTSAVLALDVLFLWALLLLMTKLRGQRPRLAGASGGTSVGARARARLGAGYRLAIGVGILAGMIAQFRSEVDVLLGASLLLVAWLNRAVFRRGQRPGARPGARPRLASPMIAVVVLSAATVCAPWVIRNYLVFHKPIITTTNGGFNFWRGHSAEATGSAIGRDGTAVWTTEATWKQIEPSGGSVGARVDSNVEFAQDAFLWSDARHWIYDHPALEAQRAVEKVFFFLVIDWHNPQARSVPYLIVYFLTMIAAIAGIVRVRRERLWKNPVVRDALALMLLWVIFYTGVAVVFFPLPRLQVILTGFYFPVVIYGVEAIIDWTRKKLPHFAVSSEG